MVDRAPCRLGPVAPTETFGTGRESRSLTEPKTSPAVPARSGAETANPSAVDIRRFINCLAQSAMAPSPVVLPEKKLRSDAGVIGRPDQGHPVEHPVGRGIGPEQADIEREEVLRGAEQDKIDTAFVVGRNGKNRAQQQLIGAAGADDLARVRLEPGVGEAGADE